MTTKLKGSEFVTVTEPTALNTSAHARAKQTMSTQSLITRRNLRRERRAVRAI